ncbi:MAG: hypothetical protein E7213_11610 [Clostridium sp.]|jgi:acyl transferase domain-containing protein/acyl carrier protein|nr:hypothetical protein [Clostridium sp.]
MFDYNFFNLTPKEASLMDPRQRLFLEVAWQAIEDAGYSADELKGKQVGVYVGLSDFFDDKYLDIVSKMDSDSVDTAISGNFSAILPSRLSYVLDLKGPCMAVDTACSSSLTALHLACKAIKNKECEMGIVGGVRIHLLPLKHRPGIGIESSDGITRTFDDKADGTGIGEGAAVLILKSLNAAKRDHDNIYAVIKGSAVNQDGNSIGITAPNSDSQADVIERACLDAGIPMDTISYIEGHGTGTSLGDPIEIDGLEKAFKRHTLKKQFCAIGSVKSNLGHMYDLSGVISVIKSVLCLKNKEILPTINFDRPNSKIDFVNSPVYVNTELKQWNVDSVKRRCGISSFGLSGTNVHVILEEAPEKEKTENDSEKYIFTLSAKSKRSLKLLMKKYSEFLDNTTSTLKDICYTASVGRKHHNLRKAFLVSSIDELKMYINQVLELDNINNENIFSGEAKSQNLSSQCNEIIKKVYEETGEREKYLKKLCELYVSGADVKWLRVYKNKKVFRVRLPFYEFNRKRCWAGINKYKSLVQENGKYIKKNIRLEGREEEKYSDIEIKLAEIFNRVMGFTVININDNFSNLGADSLLLGKAHTLIQESFSKNISITDLFTYPTIEKLADYIQSSNIKIRKNIVEKKLKLQEQDDNDIAIIGVAGRFPLADNAYQYWENIKNGVECISDFPRNRIKDVDVLLDGNSNVKYLRGGYLEEIDKFDFKFFGISPKEASLMDPAQRIFLQTAWKVIEDAGYKKEDINNTKTGVYLGYANDLLNSYGKFINKIEPESSAISLAGNLPSIIPSRISYYLNLKGPSLLIDTACSSSLVAIHLARKSILDGECDMAIAGGIKISLLPIREKDKDIGIESPEYKTRTFDDKANGIAIGEGVGAVLLKPLRRAISDNDNIYAVIKGSAMNQDGTSMGITSPNSLSQSEVIEEAWNDAKINPSSVSYIEAHGTGTKIGDPIEIEAISRWLRKYTDKKQFCAIGSVKPNIGHLYEAAGIGNIIKVIMALKNKQIPPSINFDRPNERVNFIDSPIYVNNTLKDWNTDGEKRVCGISSFGLSGTNCHIVMEEYKNPEYEALDSGINIITLSAKGKKSLEMLVEDYIRFLSEEDFDVSIENICYTANTKRDIYDKRLALAVRNRIDLREKLINIRDFGIDYIQDKDIFLSTVDGNVEDSYELKKMLLDKKNIAFDFNKERKIEDARKLCMLFTAGILVDWDIVYADKRISTVHVPGYAFEKNRCWLNVRAYKERVPRVEDIINGTAFGNIPSELSKEIKEVFNKWKYKNVIKEKTIDHQVTLTGRKNEIYSKNEYLVAKAWAEVLGFDEINIYNDFYSVGGDSILAMKMAKVIGKENIKLSVSDILQHDTVEKLAQYINKLNEEEYEEIKVLDKKEYYETSSAQKRMYISYVTYGGTSDNLPMLLVVNDEVDKERLREAIVKITERHEVLRTSFEFIDGNIYQRVCEEPRVDFTYVESNEEDAKKIVNSFVTEFDLKSAPLLKVKLVKVRENKYEILIDMHHIISDWTSLGILINEMLQIYSGKVLTDLKVQYRDFTAWQNKLLDSKKLKIQEKYWIDRFSDGVPVLKIPTDYFRPDIKRTEGNSFDFVINKEITEKLNLMISKNKFTLFMIMIAVFNILLHKYSGQTDIVIGTPISGRHYNDIQNNIGMFINTLALRNKIDSNQTFSEFLDRVKQNTLKAYDNQDYPIDNLVEKLIIERDASRSPLFDVMFILQNSNKDQLNRMDNKVHGERIDNKVSNFDMTLEAVEVSGQISCEIQYCTALFKKESIKNLANDYIDIIKQILKDENIRIHDISISKVPATSKINELYVDFDF